MLQLRAIVMRMCYLSSSSIYLPAHNENESASGSGMANICIWQPFLVVNETKRNWN